MAVCAKWRPGRLGVTLLVRGLLDLRRPCARAVEDVDEVAAVVEPMEVVGGVVGPRPARGHPSPAADRWKVLAVLVAQLRVRW